MSPYPNIPTPLPIGTEFFDEMIEKGYYYIDKTLLIQEILDKRSKVNLFTRPRRFGKTLNQTMLKCFFEDTSIISEESREKRVEREEWKPPWAKDKRHLFNGLKIEAAGEGRYMEEQGKYPVIFLTLKGAKHDSWEASYASLKGMISNEFRRHDYVIKTGKLKPANKEKFERLVANKGEPDDYTDSLRFLSECLNTYHGKKTIILIDEYDVPLESAWFAGFYKSMIDFIRSFFGLALKTNDSLEFAVLTGCLRISKESIFTGLNNLNIVSIVSRSYAEYFGFIPAEVEAMLCYYKMENRRDIIKSWYNGYIFGNNTQIYNPWSIINAVSDLKDFPNAYPKPYWSNTSSNSIVRTLIDKADDAAKKDLETLVAGGFIQKIIHEDITYDEIDKEINNLWNFLFFTGYLTKFGESMEGDKIVLDLKVPNRELHYIFNTKIEDWFREKIRQKDYSKLYTAILAGDTDSFEKEISDVLFQSISYLDNSESFYHGLLVGILAKLQDWSLKSNREAGWGRSDIYLKYKNFRGKAIIFELKYAEKVMGLEAKCDEALAQIEKNKYTADLEEDGYRPENIIKYGIAFSGKNCMVKNI
ncbi:hypothetical protein AGMMS49938_04310 [Fibrobacterales bacterium]|nr:hypothetical protein AGMMS49938_04310 [Fibrobacterales bacterium]